MKIKNLVEPKIFLWVIGLFFALGSLVYIKESIITSASFFLLTILTLPPFSSLPSFLIKKPIKKSAKLMIGFLLLLIAIKFTPTTEKVTKKPVLDIPLASTLTTIPTVIPTPTLTINSDLVTLVRIVDGDTIVVKINNEQATVRLIGIDTPEVVDSRKPVQCFGKEASEKLEKLINGKNIILTPDSTQDDKDKYNRLLRYVHLGDGTFVNQKMIEEGYAFEYTYNVAYKYQGEFKEAQKQAEAKKLGLWTDNVCPILTQTPTIKPTAKPQPTKIPTIKPVTIQNKVDTYVAPLVQINSTGSWACDCSKTCSNMSSCAEAQYQLNTCGCQARDGDDDGMACDSDCQ